MDFEKAFDKVYLKKIEAHAWTHQRGAWNWADVLSAITRRSRVYEYTMDGCDVDVMWM